MADTINDGAAPDGDAPATGAVPWHLWAVGTVALLWHTFPAVDSALTLLRVPAWTSQADAATLSHVYAAPIWANFAWIVGGWSGLVGAVLILLRSRYAPHAFIASLAGAAVSFSYQYSAGVLLSLAFALVILASEIFFWWYAARMRDEGVLR